MHRLIICAFAVVSLNSFGAASPELALSQEVAKSDALHCLITVTQGPSKTPFCIAYRSTATEKVYACLVASTKLNESILPDAAQVLVDALPVDDMDFCSRESRRGSERFDTCMHSLFYSNTVSKKILEGAVSKDILSNTLAVFFMLKKSRFNGKPFIKPFYLGSEVSGRWYDVQHKGLDENRVYLRANASGYSERSVGVNFKEYDLDVEFNYGACMEYFPKPEAGCCSIL